MIPLNAFKDKSFLIVGLGKSGQGAVHALTAAGATIHAWDDTLEARASVGELALTSIDAIDWGKIDAVIWSPGIPHTLPKPHPIAVAARTANVPLICDVDLLAQAKPNCTFIGVTGTNGKSTTTSLIAHIITQSGRPCAAGGNLGTPALDLPDLPANGVYVLELSSYQLELVPSLTLNVAVHLNISPDHIDRHSDLSGYIAAKAHLFDHAATRGIAVIATDDADSRAIAQSIAARTDWQVLPVATEAVAKHGITVQTGHLMDASSGTPEHILDLAEVPALTGRHNHQNAAAAYAATSAIGISIADIVPALRTYPGLAHRQERIATFQNVLYINDSKATNADATEKALSSYDTLFWILGGQPKAGGITSLTRYFPRVIKAYLIGQAADDFAKTIGSTIPFVHCGTLKAATALCCAEAEAFAAAHSGRRPVVMLSPSCASWDQFASFEARGDAFRAQVLQHIALA
ncbi:MAG: UDP-N-acetylmuramoyl-L-alanine--D-glutamate ligase, partial [Rhodospirillaceae bacterium]|nr:UDP-N-acetylmuramoyl-L-alanine--D-glutamate ligase [Rhodospirillaceae bacterium]